MLCISHSPLFSLLSCAVEHTVCVFIGEFSLASIFKLLLVLDPVHGAGTLRPAGHSLPEGLAVCWQEGESQDIAAGKDGVGF